MPPTEENFIVVSTSWARIVTVVANVDVHGVVDFTDFLLNPRGDSVANHAGAQSVHALIPGLPPGRIAHHLPQAPLAQATHVGEVDEGPGHGDGAWDRCSP